MKIRALIATFGVLLLQVGFYFVYRPLCPISLGALLLLLAARGGKSK